MEGVNDKQEKITARKGEYEDIKIYINFLSIPDHFIMQQSSRKTYKKSGSESLKIPSITGTTPSFGLCHC